MPYHSHNRGSGGRGGRGSGGRGGNYGRGGGGGRYGGRGGGKDSQYEAIMGRPAINICTWHLSGTCTKGTKCNNSKSLTIISKVDNSNKDDTTKNNANNYNNWNNQNKFHPTSDIALWLEKPDSPLKIFTSSHDGHWRLFNTLNGQFNKEFEHNMGGAVNVIIVAHNFLFCGFEAISKKIPNQKVGMVFAWNLTNPGDAPMELHMGLGGNEAHRTNMTPYAHSRGVTALITHGDVCFTGGKDHIIRIWKFEQTMNGGKGGFQLTKECCGHVGEITGFVFLNGMLWSSSTDGTIRLWESASNWECKHLIVGPPDGNATTTGNTAQAQPPNTPNGTSGQAVGHSAAVTSLLHLQNDQLGGGGSSYILSSSLDGTIKIWDSANGNCLSTTSHGLGIVSMALSTDNNGKPILLCGTENGSIVIRGILQTAKTAPMALLCYISSSPHYGHNGAVYSIVTGPPNTNYANTFYTAGEDGKMLIWQITGDLGMS